MCIFKIIKDTCTTSSLLPGSIRWLVHHQYVILAVYVQHIYWGSNYANNANKQKGPALGLIQSILTVSHCRYHCTVDVLLLIELN